MALLVEPLLDNIFRRFRSVCNFFDGRDAFPIALWAEVDFGDVSVHLFKAKKCSKKTKSRVAKH